MKMKKAIYAVIFLLLISVVVAQEYHPFKVYFFYGDGCPHCAKEEPFLESLEAKYPTLEVEKYEVWYNQDNADLMINLSKACSVDLGGVPATFIGDDVVIGFDSEDRRGKLIEEKIVACLESGDCIDPMDKLDSEYCEKPKQEEESIVNIPGLGEIDVTTISLPVLAVILGLADGFNACAMFVLLILLSLLLRTKSRKRMALVAGIFVFVSGFVYFLFMSVWLNAFILLGKIMLVYEIVGVIALIVGVINLKEVFFFKKGPSLTISDKRKPAIFKKMRNVVNATSLPMMILGVIVLAVSVNFVEFICTFGFPMVFTNVLAAANISNLAKHLYLVLYQVFYMFDDTVVVAIVIITLSRKKVTQHYGKILKLISGILMLILGVILLIRPQLLMFS